MDSFLSALKNLDWSVLTDMLMAVIPALVCITLHELSHGFVAYKLGDNTAKSMGRLTLNPIKHIDIFGLIMMIAFKFGWAKPVPVDMRNFKHPKRDMAITALAGPLANLLITCVALFIFGLAYVPCVSASSEFWGSVLNMVYITAYLSISLAIFNIIPVPPLDGSKILFSLVSDEAYLKLMRYERYGMLLLMILVISDSFGNILSTVSAAVFNFLLIFADWGFALYSLIF